LRLLVLLLRDVGMSELGMRGNKVGLGMAAFNTKYTLHLAIQIQMPSSRAHIQTYRNKSLLLHLQYDVNPSPSLGIVLSGNPPSAALITTHQG
jgi:hypothetical protein